MDDWVGSVRDRAESLAKEIADHAALLQRAAEAHKVAIDDAETLRSALDAEKKTLEAEKAQVEIIKAEMHAEQERIRARESERDKEEKEKEKRLQQKIEALQTKGQMISKKESDLDARMVEMEAESKKAKDESARMASELASMRLKSPRGQQQQQQIRPSQKSKTPTTEETILQRTVAAREKEAKEARAESNRLAENASADAARRKRLEGEIAKLKAALSVAQHGSQPQDHIQLQQALEKALADVKRAQHRAERAESVLRSKSKALPESASPEPQMMADNDLLESLNKSEKEVADAKRRLAKESEAKKRAERGETEARRRAETEAKKRAELEAEVKRRDSPRAMSHSNHVSEAERKKKAALEREISNLKSESVRMALALEEANQRLEAAATAAEQASNAVTMALSDASAATVASARASANAAAVAAKKARALILGGSTRKLRVREDPKKNHDDEVAFLQPLKRKHSDGAVMPLQESLAQAAEILAPHGITITKEGLFHYELVVEDDFETWRPLRLAQMRERMVPADWIDAGRLRSARGASPPPRKGDNVSS